MPLSDSITSSKPSSPPRMASSSSSPSFPGDAQESGGQEAIGDLDDSQAPVKLSRAEMTDEIVFYLQNMVVDAVYGDFLSGIRKRRYEPEWPMDLTRPQLKLEKPGDQAAADSTFGELYDALKQWHLKEGDADFNEEVEEWQRQICSFLLQYHQEKNQDLPSPEKHYGWFGLYPNIPDATSEANVWAVINLTNLALKRGDLELADRRITVAVLTANQLDYAPMTARCWYWRGVVANRLGDRVSAAECFLEAMPCVGFYQEGELMCQWVDNYKLDMLDLLDKQDAADGQSAWSRQCRRAILGIDPWFRRLRARAKYSWSTLLVTPRAPGAPRLHSVQSQEDTTDPRYAEGNEMLTRLAAELDLDDENTVLPRGPDWALLKRLEIAAEKSESVSDEIIYRLLEGFSLAFEKITRYDEFVEGFDNYPDLEGSIAEVVLQQGLLLRDQMLSEPEALEQSLSSSLQDRESPKSSDAPLRTPTDVYGEIRRLDISAEQKIAAYAQALSREDHFFDAEKNDRRRQLEQDVDWQKDHRRVLDTYEERVRQEVIQKPNLSLGTIRRKIRNDDIFHLRDTWGRDGIRPRTLSSERARRAEELRQDNEARLRRFKAELINWTYKRKEQAWGRIPQYRRRFIPKPARPNSVIEWLETNTDNTLPLGYSSHSTLQYPITPMGDMMKISDLPTENAATATKVVEPATDASTPRQPTRAPHSHSTDLHHVVESRDTGNGLTGADLLSVQPYGSDRRRASAAVDAISNALQSARRSGANLSPEQLTNIGDQAIERLVDTDHTKPDQPEQRYAGPAQRQSPLRRGRLSSSSSSGMEGHTRIKLARDYQLGTNALPPPQRASSSPPKRLYPSLPVTESPRHISAKQKSPRQPNADANADADANANGDPDHDQHHQHEDEDGQHERSSIPPFPPQPIGKLAMTNGELRQCLADDLASGGTAGGEEEEEGEYEGEMGEEGEYEGGDEGDWEDEEEGAGEEVEYDTLDQYLGQGEEVDGDGRADTF